MKNSTELDNIFVAENSDTGVPDLAVSQKSEISSNICEILSSSCEMNSVRSDLNISEALQIPTENLQEEGILKLLLIANSISHAYIQ